MADKSKIDQEIGEVQSLKGLTAVYGEVAAVRMRKIREMVLKNRDFLSSIESIFQDSLAAYANKLKKLMKEGKIRENEKVTFLAHNGKTVATLISANTRFYGDVVKETFEKFLADVRRFDYEVTVIGKVGKGMFADAEPGRPFTYFEMPDFGIDLDAVSQIVAHLVQYEQIKVYYAKYLTVVNQKPESFDISAGTVVSDVSKSPVISFLFEPSLEKVLMFFETQIFASLFDQSIRESQLAKSASRIIAMDRAAGSIEKRLEELRHDRIKLRHIVEDKKLVSTVAPIIGLGM